MQIKPTGNDQKESLEEKLLQARLSSAGGYYGSRTRYAIILNQVFDFDWFYLSGTDTSANGKLVRAEKTAFSKALKEKHPGYTNPSAIWARIRAVAEKERYASPVKHNVDEVERSSMQELNDQICNTDWSAISKDYCKDLSPEEVKKLMEKGRERIRKIEAKALRSLVRKNKSVNDLANSLVFIDPKIITEFMSEAKAINRAPWEIVRDWINEFLQKSERPPED